MKKPLVSIIIPFVGMDKYARECIRACLGMDFKNFEIILLPDRPIKESFPKSRVFPTGHVKPSVKRNLGISKSRGRFIALIDSDAYPRRDWLSNAIKHLKGDVGIAGGPNLSPPGDSVMQKAGDDILSSRMGAGSFSARYSGGEKMHIGELPSCNLVFRKKLFEELGGFDTSLLTAEDAKFCFQARRELGKKVLYSPDVVVYHHRRPLFRPHLRQIWNYGRDKARVLKTFSPSNKLLYFLPSLFVLYLFLGFLVSFNPIADMIFIRNLYLGLIVFYLLVVLIASVMKSIRRSPLIFAGIILTHITYGLGFLYGLLL